MSRRCCRDCGFSWLSSSSSSWAACGRFPPPPPRPLLLPRRSSPHSSSSCRIGCLKKNECITYVLFSQSLFNSSHLPFILPSSPLEIKMARKEISKRGNGKRNVNRVVKEWKASFPSLYRMQVRISRFSSSHLSTFLFPFVFLLPFPALQRGEGFIFFLKINYRVETRKI